VGNVEGTRRGVTRVSILPYPGGGILGAGWSGWSWVGGVFPCSGFTFPVMS